MDFGLSDDQRDLVASVRDVLQAECPPDVVRGVVEGTGDPLGLWRQAVALGWPALVVDEEHGGLGLGAVELMLIATELGRVVAPGPFAATLAGFATVVAEAGTEAQRDHWLPRIAEGAVTGTLAVAESGRWDARPTLVAKRDGDGYRLDGTKTHVLDGDRVDELVVSADGGDGISLFVVPVGDATITPAAALDASRGLATITLDGVTVGPDRMLGEAGQATDALRRAIEVATVATAAETTGTCQALLDLTVDYAKVREQFDVPIGSFQAVKHALADVELAVQKATAVVQFAAMTLAEDDPRRSAATSMAKAAAGDAQRLAAGVAIQLHGGVAYTWEHDAHLFVKRAKAGDALFGTAAQHRQALATTLLAGA